MSVASHLNIPLDEYDARIRTFIPRYDEMLDAAARALGALPASRAPVVVDLGTGTGALAERCLRVRPEASLICIDADAEILELARRRLARARHVELRRVSFTRALIPHADAVTASLALHHVKRETSKVRLYGRIAAALRPGGLFVTADCFPPSDRRLAKVAREMFRNHLRQTYSEKETRAYFAAWAREDRYFALDRELEMLRTNGLCADVVWRHADMAVIAARKS